MKLINTLFPGWQNKRRLAKQHAPIDQARREFSLAVADLSQRSSTVSRIAEDAIRSMHRGDRK